MTKTKHIHGLKNKTYKTGQIPKRYGIVKQADGAYFYLCEYGFWHKDFSKINMWTSPPYHYMGKSKGSYPDKEGGFIINIERFCNLLGMEYDRIPYLNSNQRKALRQNKVSIKDLCK